MENISSIISILKKRKSKTNALIGFDGFIDEICCVVKERTTQEDFTLISTIKELSNHIGKYAGLSLGLELVPQYSKLGGNAPIMGNCIHSLGTNLNFIGAIGEHNIHELFEDFHHKCDNCFSIADPGHTDALEFDDGKLMFGKVKPMFQITWENILINVGETKTYELVKKMDLIAFCNWTIVFDMNNIIKGITKILEKTKHKPFTFFDLADPSKRNKEDIEQLISRVKEIQNVSNVIFGLNKNESNQIANVLNIKEQNLVLRAEKIQKKLGVFCCVIHALDGASVSWEKESKWVHGPYTAKPKLSTGAGDNFNAGYCFGLLNGLNPSQALFSGVCSSGFYVRNCHSPSLEELISFMDKFNRGDIND